MPNISIIINTRNRAEHLLKTLESLRQVAIPDGLSAELIVVDNGSTDGTKDVVMNVSLPHLPVRYLLEPRKGLSHARNTGLLAAGGQIILFTDDDVRPCQNWIAGMIDPIISKKASVVAGGVVLAPHFVRPWMDEFHRSLFADTVLLDSQNPKGLVGANMAFSRDVLCKVPAFDPDLGAGALGFAEDTLFAYQVQVAGYSIWPAFSAIVEHHPDKRRLSQSNLKEHAVKLGRSLAYLAYHWQHEPKGGTLFWSEEAVLWLKLLRCMLRIVWLRWRRLSWPYEDGLPRNELGAYMHFGYIRHYLHEKRTPRHYEKRGLVKLHQYL